MFFDRSYCKVEVVNSSSQPVIGCVYKVQARRDTTVSPITAWQSGMAGASGTPMTSTTTYGATPYMSPYFCSQFRIVDQWGCHLNSGEQREWTINLRNGKFSQAVLQSSNTNFSKWTTFLIFVFWGSSVHSFANQAIVSTAPVRLDYIVNEYYDYRTMAIGNTRIVAPATLPTFTDPISYQNTGVAGPATNA